MDGIAKGVIGYVAASIGFAVDVENVINRIGLVFTLSMAQSGLLYVIAHWLLGDPTYRFLPVVELISAAGELRGGGAVVCGAGSVPDEGLVAVESYLELDQLFERRV